MSNFISYDKYRYFVNRKIPAIFYFEDSSDILNIEVIEIMEETKKTYPMILCYKVKWCRKYLPGVIMTINKNSDVVCFAKNIQKYIVSVYNTSLLNNLFKTVYNDCVCNFLRHFNTILMKENKITHGHIHQLYDITNPSYPILLKYKSYDEIEKRSTCIDKPQTKHYENLITSIYEIKSPEYDEKSFFYQNDTQSSLIFSNDANCSSYSNQSINDLQATYNLANMNSHQRERYDTIDNESFQQKIINQNKSIPKCKKIYKLNHEYNYHQQTPDKYEIYNRFNKNCKVVTLNSKDQYNNFSKSVNSIKNSFETYINDKSYCRNLQNIKYDSISSDTYNLSDSYLPYIIEKHNEIYNISQNSSHTTPFRNVFTLNKSFNNIYKIRRSFKYKIHRFRPYPKKTSKNTLSRS